MKPRCARASVARHVESFVCVVEYRQVYGRTRMWTIDGKKTDEYGVLWLRFTGAVFVLLETGQSRSAIPSQFVFTCSWFSAVQYYITNLLRSDHKRSLLNAVRLSRSSLSHRT